jgi:hypothetical protein
MGIIAFLLLCIVVGLIVWLAITFVPMPEQFKRALPIIAIILLVVLLLALMFGAGHDVMIPRLR